MMQEQSLCQAATLSFNNKGKITLWIVDNNIISEQMLMSPLLWNVIILCMVKIQAPQERYDFRDACRSYGGTDQENSPGYFI